MCANPEDDQNMRTVAWAATMEGHKRADSAIRYAHADEHPLIGNIRELGPLDRMAREQIEDSYLASGATRAIGAGNRSREEEPDTQRTCFERDRDRILHSTAFRRLAG